MLVPLIVAADTGKLSCRCDALADNVHYVQGRGVVQHPFEGQLAEELTVYRGEEVNASWLQCDS